MGTDTAPLGPAAYALDPLKDSRHREARAARDVADWLKHLEIAKKAPRTIDSYERSVAALLRAFPHKAFDEFTDGDLVHVLVQFPEASRHVNRSAFASFFKWGYQQRRIPANPIDLVPFIRHTPKRIHDTFTTAEIDALCGLSSPDGHLMTLLLWTGLRRLEACLMTGKRLDFNNRQVVVIEGAKGSRDRKVPMLPNVERAMSELVILEGIDRDDYLWPSFPGGTKDPRRNSPIHHNSFAKWWTRCLQEAGVRYRVPHTSRHTFATEMRAAGLPMEYVQVLLGHASIKTTMDIYVHTNVATIADQMRALHIP